MCCCISARARSATGQHRCPPGRCPRPADNPQIVLAVIVENAGFGARAAAPIARRVFDYYLLGQQPTASKLVKDNNHDANG